MTKRRRQTGELSPRGPSKSVRPWSLPPPPLPDRRQFDVSRRRAGCDGRLLRGCINTDGDATAAGPQDSRMSGSVEIDGRNGETRLCGGVANTINATLTTAASCHCAMVPPPMQLKLAFTITQTCVHLPLTGANLCLVCTVSCCSEVPSTDTPGQCCV